MYTHKLCTSLADMYVSWAWELEQSGGIKKAEQVFQKGLEKVEGEQAREVLNRARERFQARVIKQTMERQQEDGGEGEEREKEEQRAVLASLRGQGQRQKVGSVRVGAAKKSDRPGLMHTAADFPKANTSRPFSIYQVDDDGTL